VGTDVEVLVELEASSIALSDIDCCLSASAAIVFATDGGAATGFRRGAAGLKLVDLFFRSNELIVTVVCYSYPECREILYAMLEQMDVVDGSGSD
jgi:hypothetical protein